MPREAVESLLKASGLGRKSFTNEKDGHISCKEVAFRAVAFRAIVLPSSPQTGLG